MFVEIFLCCSPDTGSVGDSLNRHHIYSRKNLCWCLESLSCLFFFHRCLADVSQVTFRVFHLYKYPRWLSWCTLICIKNHWIWLACSLWSVAKMRSKWLDIKDNCVLGSTVFPGTRYRCRRWWWICPRCCILIQMYSTMNIICYILSISLGYTSWSSLCPVVVLVAVILCTIFLPPSKKVWSVPHVFEGTVADCYVH